jgi:hypothetical protein
MKFKEYIDHCTWEELKTTKGVKAFMKRSLADLKRLEPKYTDETWKYTIHFSENSKFEWTNENKKQLLWLNSKLIDCFDKLKINHLTAEIKVIYQHTDI